MVTDESRERVSAIHDSRSGRRENARKATAAFPRREFLVEPAVRDTSASRVFFMRARRGSPTHGQPRAAPVGSSVAIGGVGLNIESTAARIDRADLSAPFRILFVCTANICRSPMAEYLLQMVLAEGADQGTGFQLRSAGTHGYDGAEMDPPAAEQLRRLGGHPCGFRSQMLTPRHCQEARAHPDGDPRAAFAAADREPRALRRTFTLLEFAQASVQVRERWPSISDPAEVVMLAAAARSRVSLDVYDVADPYGGSADQHRIAAETILAATTTIAAG